MQCDNDGFREISRLFDRRRPNEHIQCGLRHSIGSPAAKTIVVDTAYTRRQHGKHGFMLATQLRQKMLGNQCWPERINREYLCERPRIQIAQALFRPDHRIAVEDAAGNYDEIKRSIRRRDRGRVLDRGLVNCERRQQLTD